MLPIPPRTLVVLAGAAAVLLAVHFVLRAEREKGRLQCKAEVEAAVARKAKADAAAISEIANEAQRMQTRLAAARSATAVAAERLRGAVAGNGLVIRPSASTASAPAGDAELLSAELLERAVRLAALADERGAAGDACERAYDAVSGP